jgi:hypothetical protein
MCCTDKNKGPTIEACCQTLSQKQTLLEVEKAADQARKLAYSEQTNPRW